MLIIWQMPAAAELSDVLTVRCSAAYLPRCAAVSLTAHWTLCHGGSSSSSWFALLVVPACCVVHGGPSLATTWVGLRGGLDAVLHCCRGLMGCTAKHMDT